MGAAAAAPGVGVGVGRACLRKGPGTAPRLGERRPAARLLLALPLVLRREPAAARAALRTAFAWAVFAFALLSLADTLWLTRSMRPDSQARSRFGEKHCRGGGAADAPTRRGPYGVAAAVAQQPKQEHTDCCSSSSNECACIEI